MKNSDKETILNNLISYIKNNFDNVDESIEAQELESKIAEIGAVYKKVDSFIRWDLGDKHFLSFHELRGQIGQLKDKYKNIKALQKLYKDEDIMLFDSLVKEHQELETKLLVIPIDKKQKLTDQKTLLQKTKRKLSRREVNKTSAKIIKELKIILIDLKIRWLTMKITDIQKKYESNERKLWNKNYPMTKFITKTARGRANYDVEGSLNEKINRKEYLQKSVKIKLTKSKDITVNKLMENLNHSKDPKKATQLIQGILKEIAPSQDPTLSSKGKGP